MKMNTRVGNEVTTKAILSPVATIMMAQKLNWLL